MRGTVARRVDDIDQLQPKFAGFDFAHTRRDSVDAQVDLPEIRRAPRSFGVQHSDENTDAQFLRHGVRREHRASRRRSCRTSSRRPSSARASRSAASIMRLSAASSRGTPKSALSFDTGTRVTLAGGKAFRAPDSHRPLRLRRQSGSRSGSVAPGGNHRAPEVRRAPAGVALGVRQSHPRSHQLRRHRLRHVRGREPQHRSRPHQGRASSATQYANAGWRARAELTLQDPRDETTDERLLRRSRESRSSP